MNPTNSFLIVVAVIFCVLLGYSGVTATATMADYTSTGTIVSNTSSSISTPSNTSGTTSPSTTSNGGGTTTSHSATNSVFSQQQSMALPISILGVIISSFFGYI